MKQMELLGLLWINAMFNGDREEMNRIISLMEMETNHDNTNNGNKRTDYNNPEYIPFTED